MPIPLIKHQDVLPPELEERVYRNHRGHVEAAHELLHYTLALWEADDWDDSSLVRVLVAPRTDNSLNDVQIRFPIDIEPSRENVLMLSQTLEADEAYFRLLSETVEILLGYMAREREILREWFQSGGMG